MTAAMKKYKAILFDFDGVMAKTMEDNFAAWDKALATVNISIAREEYYKIEGKSALRVAEFFLEQYHRDLRQAPSIAKLKDDYYAKHNSFMLYEGAEELIHYLKECNYRVGLVTGASRKRLIRSGLETFLAQFDVVIAGDEAKDGKPSPFPYLQAAEGLKFLPHECLVIENAPLGIQSAKGAHMDCIAITSTLGRDQLREADLVIETLRDLQYYFEAQEEGPHEGETL